ncbi:MAG: M23 family metallopeptidase [Candidatus Eisenbacteria bacterium]
MRALLASASTLSLFAALLPPLAQSPGLTSGFGEYREGRFHAGLDYSTEATTGKPVRAVADGWIERVRASGVGYGRAVYLRLPDGRTAVYAHLSRFAPALADWVAAQQESAGRYELDLVPPPGAFPFRQGEVVAWSGESGAGPPHLHFEIRRGDMNLHPLRQGIAVADATPPSLTAVTITPSGPRARVGGGIDPWRGGFPASGELAAPTVSGSFRLAVDTWDRSGDRPNHIATYRLRALLDGTPAYEAVLDSVSWEQMPIADRIFDLAATQAGMNDRRLLQSTPGDHATIVRLGVPVWSLTPGEHRLELVAEDEAGNRTSRTLRLGVLAPGADSASRAKAPVGARLLAGARAGRPAVNARDLVVHVATRAGDERPPLAAWRGLELIDSLAVAGGTVWSLAAVATAAGPPGLPVVLRAGRDAGRATLSGGPGAAHEATLEWDSWSFHEPAAVVVAEEPFDAKVGEGRFAATARMLVLRPVDLALARPLRIRWREPGVTVRNVGLFRSTGGRFSLVAPRDSSGGWSASTRRLGTFALLADTTAPRLVPPARYAARVGHVAPAFSVRLSDPGSGLAASEQRVTFDGRPVPAEYDVEAGRLTWRPRAPLPAGAHVIVVEAVDGLGNRSSVRVPVEVR